MYDPKGLEVEYVGGPFDGQHDRQCLLPDFILAPPIAGGAVQYRLEHQGEKLVYIFVPEGQQLV